MRTVPSVLRAFGLLLVLTLLAGPVALVGGAVLAGPALAQTAPAPEPSAPPADGGEGADIDVAIDTDGGAWYADPFWIVIGAIAVIVVVVLAVAAGRGNGTTVVNT